METTCLRAELLVLPEQIFSSSDELLADRPRQFEGKNQIDPLCSTSYT